MSFRWLSERLVGNTMSKLIIKSPFWFLECGMGIPSPFSLCTYPGITTSVMATFNSRLSRVVTLIVGPINASKREISVVQVRLLPERINRGCFSSLTMKTMLVPCLILVPSAYPFPTATEASTSLLGKIILLVVPVYSSAREHRSGIVVVVVVASPSVRLRFVPLLLKKDLKNSAVCCVSVKFLSGFCMSYIFRFSGSHNTSRASLMRFIVGSARLSFLRRSGCLIWMEEGGLEGPRGYWVWGGSRKKTI